MMCPRCGAWSEVLDTRKGAFDTIRRRRECANGHRFATLEMTSNARNVGSMQRAHQTAKAARAKWLRDEAIRKDARPRAQVAAAYGLHPSTVTDIRSGRR